MLQISFVLLIYWTLFRLIDGQISDAEWEDMLEGFDERSYLNARRWKPGDDPYTLYAFNQRESERIPSNRALRDTRHYRYTQINRQHTHTHSICSSLCSESVWKVSDRVCVFNLICTTWETSAVWCVKSNLWRIMCISHTLYSLMYESVESALHRN